jgi:hypothetical protein
MWFLSRWSKKYIDRMESLEQQLGHAQAEFSRIKEYSQNLERELNAAIVERDQYKTHSIYVIIEDFQDFFSIIDEVEASLSDIGQKIDITLKERGMLVEVRERFGKYLSKLKNLDQKIIEMRNTHNIELDLMQTVASASENRTEKSQKLLDIMEDFESLANDLYEEHLRTLLETSKRERLKRDQATIREMREKLADLAKRERLHQGKNPKAMAIAISPPGGAAHHLPKGFPGRRQPPPSSL